MDTDIVLIATDPMTMTPSATKGVLPASARSSSPGALGSVYASLVPLEEELDFSNVTLTTPWDVAAQTRSIDDADAAVTLRFRQTMNEIPEVMHLMYAVGTGPQLGYHAMRMCFEVTEFPECASAGEEGNDDTKNELVGSSAFPSWNMAVVPILVATAVLSYATIF